MNQTYQHGVRFMKAEFLEQKSQQFQPLVSLCLFLWDHIVIERTFFLLLLFLTF